MSRKSRRAPIRPADLSHHYSGHVSNVDEPRFSGKPDPLLFHKLEAFEVIPMLEQIMHDLRRLPTDRIALHCLEEMISHDLPPMILRREQVYNWLVAHYSGEGQRMG